MLNLLLHTDSYKQSHFAQYPPGTEFISAYAEARGSHEDGMVQFFGLQAFLTSYLSRPITAYDIDEAEAYCAGHGVPFNREGWEYILVAHKGFLPLRIQALREGAVVPRGTPLVQVVNTDPKVPWLTSFIETALLRGIWYPSSVATLSLLAKLIWYGAFKRSSDAPEMLPFRLHDFGARGASSAESAALGGMAHLVNFRGTDTMEGLFAAREFYGAEIGKAGFSIPASEHSTMTSWGQHRERDAYANMIQRFGDGTFSIVADSYDLHAAVADIFCGSLKGEIEAMDGTLVIRPDSGDPVETPLAVIQKLWEVFGGSINSKGYKVLNPKVRVIQGDGMGLASMQQLVLELLDAGFAADNLVVGMGGGLLQDHRRDDLRFALKTNAIGLAGEVIWRDVQKRPATDPGKISKAGRQAVVRGPDGDLLVKRESDLDPAEINLLQDVFVDGELVRYQTFEDVRAVADRFVQLLVELHDSEPAAAAA